MSLWEDFKTPQVKLRRRSSIFNVVLPGKQLRYSVIRSLFFNIKLSLQMNLWKFKLIL